VRVLHSLSFVDDPTRILRAVRFEQRFNFRIEERTMQLLLEALPMIERLSGDRIRHELNNILASRFSARMMARLHGLNLLIPIDPGLIWDDWLDDHFEGLASFNPEPDWELSDLQQEGTLVRDLSYALWLIRLPNEVTQRVTKRLKLPVRLTRILLGACALWHDSQVLTITSPSQVVSRLELVPPLSRYALYLATSDESLKIVLRMYAEDWRKVVPRVDGNDLKSRRLPPGPDYRLILSALRNAWLDGEISTPEEEDVFLEKLLLQAQSGMV